MFDKEVAELQRKLVDHELYSYIKTPAHLRFFMEAHLFAVWDFMSLAKRLQRELTTITLPWFPPQDPSKARFINEIILGEESDFGVDGKPASHLEMYLAAMKDMSCSSVAFETFSASLRRGETLNASLDQAALPEYVRDFVRSTLSIALEGRLEEVASSFFYGREDSIPNMFQALLDRWGLDEGKLPRLVHYLNRHIELDGEDHGPAAKKILSDLIHDDASRDRANQTARTAISMRLHLWDGILRDLKAQDGSASERLASSVSRSAAVL